MDDDFIEAREYNEAHLVKPGSFITFLVSNALKALFYLIPRICDKDYVLRILRAHLKQNLSFSIINCAQHNLAENVCHFTVQCAAFWWSRSGNKISKGLNDKFAIFWRVNQGNVILTL